MERIAIFPGSFDPITKGHEDILRRALPLFDKIIVAIGVNSTKKYMFTLDERKESIKKVFAGEPKIAVEVYQKLTVAYCRETGANYIIRGLRNSMDFNYEKSIAQMNRELDKTIETVFYITAPELSAINSTIVREIYLNGGDISAFVPAGMNVPPHIPQQ
ncbi:MAG: pantetheine-phosphate adenylyltransferase [Bacteroidota bacterium]